MRSAVATSLVSPHSSEDGLTRRLRLAPAGPPRRPLRIGLLAVNGPAIDERIAGLLRWPAIPVRPVPICLRADARFRSQWAPPGLVGFEESIREEPLDGLVVSGAIGGNASFKEMSSSTELEDILEYARAFVTSTLGLGLGAVPLASRLGIEVTPLERRLMGIFPLRRAVRAHRLLGASHALFAVQNRDFAIDDERFELAEKAHKISLLAHSSEAGCSIFQSTDQRYVAHLGQPEEAPTWPLSHDGYLETVQRGAREHRDTFFSEWLRCIWERNRLQVAA